MNAFNPLTAAVRAIRLARKDQLLFFEEGPIGDMEREALIEGLPQWCASRKGYLYLAANASWIGLYKVGCTRRSVEMRMTQLNNEGVATPWVPVASWSVYDAHGLEALAHRACAPLQVKGELFQAPYAELMARVSNCIVEDRARLERCIGRKLMPGALDEMLGSVVCLCH